MLERFGPATQDWFRGAFPRPHRRAGRRVGRDLARQARPRGRPDRIGQDAVGVPVGDRPRLPREGCGTARPARRPKRRTATDAAASPTRILYISPLKALGVDVERNLRSPLVGIGQSARRLGIAVPEVTVGVRSGDTTSSDRRKLVTAPPDILITTPESLYLMLTSQAGRDARATCTP